MITRKTSKLTCSVGYAQSRIVCPNRAAQGHRFIPGDQYRAGTESDILPFMAQARVLRLSEQTLWPTSVGSSHTTYRVMKGAYTCSRTERNIEPVKVRDRESQFGLVRQFHCLLPACFLPLPKHHPFLAVFVSGALWHSFSTYLSYFQLIQWVLFPAALQQVEIGDVGCKVNPSYSEHCMGVSIDIRDLKIRGRRRW